MNLKGILCFALVFFFIVQSMQSFNVYAKDDAYGDFHLQKGQRGIFTLLNNNPISTTLEPTDPYDIAKYTVKVGKYTTVAARSNPGSNVDLSIYSDENLTTNIGGSYLSQGIDFWLENGHNYSSDTFMYAQVKSPSSNIEHSYTIESDYNHNLSIGVKSYEHMSENEVVDTYDVFLYAGTTYTISLPQYPQSALYKIYLSLGACSASGGYLRLGNQSSPIAYTPIVSSWYAIIVTNENNINGEYQVLVNGGSFSIDVQPKQRIIFAGSSCEYNVSVSSVGGFAAEVNLAIEWPGASGLPPEGLSATFYSFSITPPGSTILTISSTSNAQPRTYNITVRGVASGISRSSWALVTIIASTQHLYNDIPANGTVEYNEDFEKYSFDVFSSYYTAVSCRSQSLTRIDVFENDALTTYVGTSISFGGISYYILDGHALTESKKYYLTIRSPLGGTISYIAEADSRAHLTLGISTNGKFAQGEIIETYDVFLYAGYTYRINVSQPEGYYSSYDIFIHGGSGPRNSALSSGNSFSPIVIVPQATGWYGIVVVNTVGIFSNYTIKAEMLTLQPDFSVSITPQIVSIEPSGLAEFDICISSLNGFASSVTFNPIGLPQGCYATFSPTEVIGEGIAKMRIYTSSTTPLGSYTIVVNCTSGNIFHHAYATIKITSAPDFTISVYPLTVYASAGSTAQFYIYLTSLNGFNSQVVLSASGLPWFLLPNMQFNPQIVTPTASSLLTIGIATFVQPGTYQFSIVARQLANETPIIHSTYVTLIITAMADFTLEVSPLQATVAQYSVANYTIDIYSLNGFDSLVTLSVLGLPAGAYYSFSENPVHPQETNPHVSVILTVFTSYANAGSYLLTIVGEGNGNEHYATCELCIVTQVDFSISVNPTEVVLGNYESSSLTVTINPINGFNMPVSLSVSGLPFDTSFIFSTNPAYPGNVFLNITTGGTIGNYVVTITAIGGSPAQTHTTTFVLSIIRSLIRLVNDIPVNEDVVLFASDKYVFNVKNYTAIVEKSNGPTRLEVFNEPFMSYPLATSEDELIDFYLIDGTSSYKTEYYARVSAGLGYTSYKIESDFQGMLQLNLPHYGTMHSEDIVETYSVYLSAGILYGITVSNITGGANYLVALFKGNGYISSSLERIQAPQKLLFTPSQSGYYGIVILNVNGVSGPYTILVDTPQDFTISVSPMQATVTPGSLVSFQVRIESINGWTHTVNLATPSLPPQVTSTFNPQQVTPSPIGYSNLTFTISASASPGSYEIVVRGNALGIRHQCVIVLTITSAPDFGMYSDPTYAEIKTGSNFVFNISVYSLNGFSNQVSLYAIGIPPGVSYTILPQPLVPDALSYLRIYVANDAPTGDFSITILGTSNEISHSIQIKLKIVKGPSLELSASPSEITLLPGETANITIFVLTSTGIGEHTLLSVSGMPTDMTCILSDTVVLPNATTSLHIQTNLTIIPGIYQIKVTASAPSQSKTIIINVNVLPPPDFRIELSPISGTCERGSACYFEVKLVPLYGFTGTASLSLEGLDPSMTYLATNNTLKPNIPEYVTIYTTTSTPSGTYSIKVIGTEISTLPIIHSHNTTYQLTVTDLPDFTITLSSSSLVVLQGSSGFVFVNVTKLNSFSGTVHLSLVGLPEGATASFSSSSVIPNATPSLTISVSQSTPQGSYILSIIGNSSGIIHYANLTLLVSGLPSFEITASPTNATVQAGSSTTYSITVYSINGFSQPVNIVVQGLPPGATANLSPTTLTPTGISILTIQTSLATPVGNYIIEIYANGGGLQDSCIVNLKVNEGPNFIIYVNPYSNSTYPGGYANFNISISPQNGFAYPVTLSAETQGVEGIVCTFEPSTIFPNNISILKVSTLPTLLVGNYQITIIARGGGIEHRINVTLKVIEASSFILIANPNNAEISPGSQQVITISAQPTGSFTDNIILSINAPEAYNAGITLTLEPSMIGPNGNATLSISTLPTTPTGTYLITIIGSSGEIAYTTHVTLKVTLEPSFTINILPSTITTYNGGYANYSAILTSLNGYSSVVTLTVDAPIGTSTTITPSNVIPNGSAILSVRVYALQPGTYQINVTGKDSEGLEKQATAWLIVTPPPSFTIELSPSINNVEAGNDAIFNVVVISHYGFSNEVALSLNTLFPLPDGFSYEFSPANLIPTSGSILTIHTPPNYQIYFPISISVIGTCGYDVVISNFVLLTVTARPSIALTPSPESITIEQGGTAIYLIEVTSLNGYSSNVTLSCVGLDENWAEITLTPSSVIPNATVVLKIETSYTAPVGNYELIIHASGPGLPLLGINTFVSLIITARPTLTLQVSPDEITVENGAEVSFLVSVGSVGQVSNPVTLSASASHPSIDLSFDANNLTPPFSTLLTVQPGLEVPPGEYLITVVAYAQDLNVVVDTVLIIITNKPDFSLYVTPSYIVLPKYSQTSLILEVTSLNSFSNEVLLSLESPTEDISATFTTNPCIPNCSVVFVLSAQAPEGTYALKVRGTYGQIERFSNVFILEITSKPTFTLSASPSELTITKGKTEHIGISANPINSFDEDIFLSVLGIPPGLEVSLNPNPISSQSYFSTLSLYASDSLQEGRYILSIVGVSGNLKEEVKIVLNVVSNADFIIRASKDYVAVPKGDEAKIEIYIEGINSFSENVKLDTLGIPYGVQANVEPSQVLPNDIAVANLIIKVNNSANEGEYILTIRGKAQLDGMLLIHTLEIKLNITSSPFFVIIANDSEKLASPAGITYFELQIIGMNGFSHAVNLDANGVPDGVEFEFSQSQGIPTFYSTFVLKLPQNIEDGLYLIEIIGTDGLNTSKTILRLNVTSKPDFEITITPTQLKVVRGKNVFFTANITLINNFPDYFTFELLSLPEGVDFKILSEVKNDIYIECTFEVETNISAELGAYSIIFLATSLNGNKSVPMILYITEDLTHTFVLDISPRVQSVTGDYAIYTIEGFWIDGTSSSIFLEAYCEALGINLNLSQKVISNGESSILLLYIGKNVPSGNYTIIVNGSSEGITITAKAWLILNRTAGNISYTLSIPKGKSVHPGKSIVYEFVLKNTDSRDASFVAYAFSKNNWNVVILGGNLTKKLLPGEELVIKVKVTIPKNAKGSDLLTFKIRPSEGSNETVGEVVTKIIIEESNAWLFALLILIAIIAIVLIFIILRRKASKRGFIEIKTDSPELKDEDIKQPETEDKKEVGKEPTQSPKQTEEKPTITSVSMPATQTEAQAKTEQQTTAKSQPAPEPLLPTRQTKVESLITSETTALPSDALPSQSVTSSAKVKCKCGNVIEVTSKERPLRIKCSNCGKEGMLKAKPQPETQNKELSEKSISSELASPSLPETKIQETKEISQKVRCKCGNVIEVTSKERPLKIKCSNCGKEGLLKSKTSSPENKENISQITSKLQQKEASAELADTSSNIDQPKPVGKVRCSACSEPIFIYTTERPLVVQCPKCGKKGRLK